MVLQALVVGMELEGPPVPSKPIFRIYCCLGDAARVKACTVHQNDRAVWAEPKAAKLRGFGALSGEACPTSPDVSFGTSPVTDRRFRSPSSVAHAL